jgi:hypothetical protein
MIDLRTPIGIFFVMVGLALVAIPFESLRRIADAALRRRNAVAGMAQAIRKGTDHSVPLKTGPTFKRF